MNCIVQNWAELGQILYYESANLALPLTNSVIDEAKKKNVRSLMETEKFYHQKCHAWPRENFVDGEGKNFPDCVTEIKGTQTFFAATAYEKLVQFAMQQLQNKVSKNNVNTIQ